VRGIGKSSIDNRGQVEDLGRARLRYLKEEFERDIGVRRGGSEGLV
jgi:hypothetical protein